MTEQTYGGYIQCPHKAVWQLCDENPVDGDTFACSEHVSPLITETTTIIVPYDGIEDCCYCLELPPEIAELPAGMVTRKEE